MSDDPDPKTPGFGDLETPFLFVPHGAPEPTEWMRRHPGWVKFPATFVPRAPAAGRTIPGTNRPWPLDKRGQPWPRSRFGQPLRPLDEYPPGVRAPGEGHTGPIADPDEAMRAALASKDVLAQAAKFAADPDAPVKAYLSAKDVWESPWKYAGYLRPKATAPVRTPDASAPFPAQQASQPPAASLQPDPLLIPTRARESVEDQTHLVRSLKSATPQGYPAPVNPFGVFIPGTPENEAWVRGAGRVIDTARGVIGNLLHGPQVVHTEGTEPKAGEASSATSGDEPVGTPVGRRGNPIEVARGTNRTTEINGRTYTGHALDRMQGRGIPPSAVEDAIQNGRKSPGNTPGTTVHTGTNGGAVVTGADGQVITVIPR